MKRIVFLVIGILALVACHDEEEYIPFLPGKNLSTLEWKSYLKGTSIYNIADAGDYIWASSGLFEIIKLDKNTEDVVFYSLDGVKKGPDWLIQSVACCKNGLPWIGVYNTGVLKMNEHEKWIPLPLMGEYKPVVVSNIHITENDTAWAAVGLRASTGGLENILVRYQGNATDVFMPDEHTLRSFAEDKDGNLWFGKTGGIVKFDGKNWTRYDSPAQWESMPNTNKLSNITIDESGSKWMLGSFGIMSPADRLIKFDGSDWQIYDLSSSQLDIHSLALQDDSIIWLGTSKGLMKFSNSRWKVFDTENSDLPNNSVFTIVVDDEGTKWLGTSNGLAAFKENGLD